MTGSGVLSTPSRGERMSSDSGMSSALGLGGIPAEHRNLMDVFPGQHASIHTLPYGPSSCLSAQGTSHATSACNLCTPIRRPA